MRAVVARKRQDREELRKLVFNERVAPAIGLYVPVVSHVCFLHHGSHKTSDYTYASLLKATQEKTFSQFAPLSPLDAFYELRHLLTWRTEIDFQVTSRRIEGRGGKEAKYKEIRKALKSFCFAASSQCTHLKMTSL